MYLITGIIIVYFIAGTIVVYFIIRAIASLIIKSFISLISLIIKLVIGLRFYSINIIII